MSARAARRRVERERLDLLAAEGYAPDAGGTAEDRALSWLARSDFLAGVTFERRRTRLVWRRRAPEWLRLIAALVVAMLAAGSCWAFLLILTALD